MIRIADDFGDGRQSPPPAESTSGEQRPPITPPEAAPQLMGIEEFAAMIACSTKHVRRLADAGKCPAPIRLGRSLRWSRAVVDDWIASGCQPVRTVRMSARR